MLHCIIIRMKCERKTRERVHQRTPTNSAPLKLPNEMGGRNSLPADPAVIPSPLPSPVKPVPGGVG